MSAELLLVVSLFILCINLDNWLNKYGLSNGYNYLLFSIKTNYYTEYSLKEKIAEASAIWHSFSNLRDEELINAVGTRLKIDNLPARIVIESLLEGSSVEVHPSYTRYVYLDSKFSLIKTVTLFTVVNSLLVALAASAILLIPQYLYSQSIAVYDKILTFTKDPCKILNKFYDDAAHRLFFLKQGIVDLNTIKKFSNDQKIQDNQLEAYSTGKVTIDQAIMIKTKFQLELLKNDLYSLDTIIKGTYPFTAKVAFETSTLDIKLAAKFTSIYQLEALVSGLEPNEAVLFTSEIKIKALNMVGINHSNIAALVNNNYQIRAFETGKITAQQILKTIDYGDLFCIQQDDVTAENVAIKCLGEDLQTQEIA